MFSKLYLAISIPALVFFSALAISCSNNNDQAEAISVDASGTIEMPTNDSNIEASCEISDSSTGTPINCAEYNDLQKCVVLTELTSTIEGDCAAPESPDPNIDLGISFHFSHSPCSTDPDILGICVTQKEECERTRYFFDFGDVPPALIQRYKELCLNGSGTWKDGPDE